MLDDIKESLLLGLHKLRLNLSQFWYLEQAYRGIEVPRNPITQPLGRMGLIIDGKITYEGKQLYEQLLKDSTAEISIGKSERDIQIKEDFEKWWQIFPRTDKFTYNGQTMHGGRTLRIGKDNCRELFRKLVLSGTWTSQQIIDGTVRDIETKMSNSLMTGKNQLTYTNNSETYLRKEAFAAWVDVDDEADSTAEDQFTFNL